MACLRDLVKHVAGNFACSQWEPGIKTIPWRSQYSTTWSHSRRQSYSGFCTLTIGTILRALSMCSSVTLDNATKRILLSSRN